MARASARRRDPETSQEAADRHDRNRAHRLVLGALHDLEQGTSMQIHAYIEEQDGQSISPEGVRGALRQLQNRNIVRVLHRNGTSTRGRRASVYVLATREAPVST